MGRSTMWDNLMNRKSVKFGLPFVIFVVGGSFFMQQFTSLRYEFRKGKKMSNAEAESLGLVLKDYKTTTGEMMKDIEDGKLDTWENIRGPRPWEDSKTFQKEERQRIAVLKEPSKRCKQWVVNTRRADLEGKPAAHLSKNNYLCSEHFESCCFSKTATKRPGLVRGAIPTIFNVPNPPPKITPSRPGPKTRPLPATREQPPPSRAGPNTRPLPATREQPPPSRPGPKTRPLPATREQPPPSRPGPKTRPLPATREQPPPSSPVQTSDSNTNVPCSSTSHGQEQRECTLKRKFKAERTKTWRMKKRLKLSNDAKQKTVTTCTTTTSKTDDTLENF